MSGHAAETAHGVSGHAADAHAADAHHDTTLEWILASASFLWGVLGLALGWFVYMRKASVADTLRKAGGGFMYRLLHNKYYVDELYEAVFIRPGFRLSRDVLWKWVDAGLIDNFLVMRSALVTLLAGSVLRVFQNGMVRFYAWSISIGLAVSVIYLSFSG